MKYFFAEKGAQEFLVGKRNIIYRAGKTKNDLRESGFAPHEVANNATSELGDAIVGRYPCRNRYCMYLRQLKVGYTW